MARLASIFVSKLSDDDRKWLVETSKTHPTHSTRARALSILLSSQGRTIIEIATVLVVDEDTARSWINRWFNGQRENLEDVHRVGGPTLLSEDGWRSNWKKFALSATAELRQKATTVIGTVTYRGFRGVT